MNGLLLELFDEPSERVDEFDEWLAEAHAADVRSLGAASDTYLYEGAIVHSARVPPRYLCLTEIDPAAIPEWRERIERRSASAGPGDGFEQHLKQRVYEPIDVVGHVSEPTRYTLAVSATVPEDKLADYHAWYTEEHTPLLHGIDGWLRTRRYELVAGDAPRILVLQDMETLEVFGSPVHRQAWSTPWRARVAAYRTDYERSMYRLLEPLTDGL